MKKRIVGVIALVVVIYLLVAGALVGSAYAEADEGQDKLRALTSADVAELRGGERDDDIAAAEEHLRTANYRLSNPALALLRPIPVVGAQLASARDLTNAGAETSALTLAALKDVRALADQPDLDRATTLRRAAEICSTSDTRLRQIDLGPQDRLISQLADARAEAVDRLNTLDDALVRCEAAASGLASLLTTEANYLLIAANNAEMRNGSGMFLQAGLLKTGNGQLDVTDMSSVAPLTVPDRSVTLPEDVEKNWAWLGRPGDIRNLMLSPRYDVSAQLARNLWEQNGKPAVDGVITVDVAMMKALLAVGGPVTVNGQTLTAENATQTLLFDQYAGINTASAAANAERRDELGDIASVAFKQFANGKWDLTAAAKELGSAAQGRHLLIWSADNELNQKWITAGVGGAMAPDSTLISAVNLGTNKMDQFLKFDNALEVRRNGDELESVVTIRVRNDAPEDGPRYVLGPLVDNGAQEGEYTGMLVATLPGDAFNARFDSDLPLALAGEDGPNVVLGTGMSVPRGNAQVFVLRYSQPTSAKGTYIEPSARIPAVTWQYRDEEWTDNQHHYASY